MTVKFGINPGPAKAYARGLRIKDAKETHTICPYCSVGCGIIVHSKDGKVVNTEGDPDHPINEGALCSKGSSLYQIVNNPTRLTKSKVKEKAADGTEKEVGKDFVVNRTDGIAHAGSAALDNEECYMLQKLVRSWGLVYIEHQARSKKSPPTGAFSNGVKKTA